MHLWAAKPFHPDGVVRTRFRKPVSHATLLNHYEWASRRNHGREMRKVREENETLKLTLKIKQAIGILLFAPLLAFGQVITIDVPEGLQVAIRRVSINAVTNALAIAPPKPSPTPLAVQMRMAAQLARGKAAPWTQRFIVTKVEESAMTRVEDDNAAPVFSTNYIVTVMAISSETNTPVAWGAVKNKSIRFVTTRPAKKGDEYEFFPVDR